MAEFLLSTDPLNRAWTTFELDSDGETIVIRRYWESDDVQAVLDANAQQANHVEQKGDMRQAARIPDIVQYEWLTKHGVRSWDPNHAEKVRELLNSNEYHRLRCWSGTI